MKPIIVGISGASGAIYGVETLKALNSLGCPAHLVISEAGALTLAYETGLGIDEVNALATKVYNVKDVGAAIAGGSFRTAGMIIAPCSIKTLSAIANSYADNLLARAADVTIKERRPLVLMVRETPLHQGHLELMARAAGLGALIMPPVPAFYAKPQSIADIVRHTVGRALDLLGVENRMTEPWQGI
ncbi:MAG: hypothetical protein A3G18_10715 [Rhodospirillales bacterium RIFCSPLOWO2_12_FULL_58_28]|nr:MAG: hypothetical protein A3H92_11070 [Rhodospirillales bacterium RIFCSPLOWO2_02_FULL_58_16]OHC77891.1 MAG: hypothetical protein A3G18_10715 [Rhodospirillales bacterium RIFCSPLOWO2_12_FULL_58_28]